LGKLPRLLDFSLVKILQILNHQLVIVHSIASLGNQAVIGLMPKQDPLVLKLFHITCFSRRIDRDFADARLLHSPLLSRFDAAIAGS
jgi:hypothetical protein